ncbi:hypothetical protein CEXT_796781 [Caerostris extrusa]|uniref:Uncharacterized protein n=1 Tax=Caerostris extrusa TaxID=172846 RepID=A0AAV4XCT3_CAEEX|nr:hypothetical protein CEXT_796781 [Caerostris extrusa]
MSTQISPKALVYDQGGRNKFRFIASPLSGQLLIMDHGLLQVAMMKNAKLFLCLPTFAIKFQISAIIEIDERSHHFCYYKRSPLPEIGLIF